LKVADGEGIQAAEDESWRDEKGDENGGEMLDLARIGSVPQTGARRERCRMGRQNGVKVKEMEEGSERQRCSREVMDCKAHCDPRLPLYPSCMLEEASSISLSFHTESKTTRGERTGVCCS
jgi:hypothetical protein